MTTSDRFGPAVAPVLASRLPIFASSLKTVQESEWEGITPWGSVRVTGRIGGMHRRLLDTMFAHATKARRNRNGSIDLLIDPYLIRKIAGGSGKGWIEQRLAELSEAKVRINGGKEGGSIIAEWQDAAKTAAFPAGLTTAKHGGQVVAAHARTLLIVTVGAVWMRIYDHTLAVKYSNLLPLLHSIKSGAAYALALHVITHREYNTQLDDALRHVRAIRDGMTERAVRKVRAAVMGEVGKLGTIGIAITAGGVVRYRQHPVVRFVSGEEENDAAEPILQGAEPILQCSQESLRDSRDSARLGAGALG